MRYQGLLMSILVVFVLAYGMPEGMHQTAIEVTVDTLFAPYRTRYGAIIDSMIRADSVKQKKKNDSIWRTR